MKEKMKQNKKYVAIFCVVFMLSSLVSLSAYSYTDNSVNNVNFQDQPIFYDPNISQSVSVSYIQNTTLIASITESNGYIYNYYVGSDDPSTYAFSYLKSNGIDYGLNCCTSNSNKNFYYFVIYNDGNNWDTFIYPQKVPMDSLNNGLYCGWYTVNKLTPANSLIPAFSNFSDGVSAVNDWINNPPPVSTPHNLDITLPAGNAIFIQYTSSSTGSISTYFNQAHGSPYSGSNQTLSYIDSIPSSFTSIGSPINWEGTGKTDILGRYRNFTKNLIPNPNHNYLVIVNPYFNSDYVDVEHEDSNYEISIHMTNVINAQFVALNSSVVSGSVSNSSSDENYYTEYDDSTNTWVTTDENGNPASPSPGGTILPVTSNSINDWLQNISNQIAGFFQGAIGAVTTLVDAGSSFFNVLVGLYSWLPPAVFSVLSSALIVIITIGVIKVFI